MNVSQILEGWRKKFQQKIFKNLDEETIDLAKKRYDICLECPLFNNDKCDTTKTTEDVTTKKIVNGCGCTLSAKVLCKDCKCPANKW